ncbi:hypothetical protein BDP81DRAFT_434454 [Colletotrichum phormii]|uniref:Uncharacterized protein n=1 Tax=Colletotrichum phormii TaxID=359342 RepID=A0AAJ0EB46_9PEZI|nr:uncharacterized protein BDP81DRAFT_434454 [Colletotrichum phormii]KAK1633217.1 hypothetical protein BDP81DRAFT_434454 [Colletotrichum phormii]
MWVRRKISSSNFSALSQPFLFFFLLEAFQAFVSMGRAVDCGCQCPPRCQDLKTDKESKLQDCSVLGGYPGLVTRIVISGNRWTAPLDSSLLCPSPVQGIEVQGSRALLKSGEPAWKVESSLKQWTRPLSPRRSEHKFGGL